MSEEMTIILAALAILVVASLVMRHPKMKWKGRCTGRCEDCGRCWKHSDKKIGEDDKRNV